VARASYIDPRIIELYEDGSTIASVLGDLATRGRAQNAVVKLLARHAPVARLAGPVRKGETAAPAGRRPPPPVHPDRNVDDAMGTLAQSA
jgi:hypothetical protein